MSTLQIIIMLAGTAISFAGLVWAIVSTNQARTERLQSIFQEKIEKLVTQIRDELHQTQIDMSKNYVLTHVYEGTTRDNTASHGVIHGKIAEIDKTMARIETRVDDCPECNRRAHV